MGIFIGNNSREFKSYLCISALAWIFCWREIWGHQKKLHVVSLSSCIGNCYLFNILNGCHHWKWFKGIVSVGNMMKQEKLRFVQLYWKLLSSWTLLLECFETNFVSVCQLWPENSEGKCGQSEEAYAGFFYLLNILDRHLSLEMFQKNLSGFFLQVCWELLSIDHIRWVLHYKMIQGNCICTSALSWKILSEGNISNQEKQCLAWEFCRSEIQETRRSYI